MHDVSLSQSQHNGEGVKERLQLMRALDLLSRSIGFECIGLSSSHPVCCFPLNPSCPAKTGPGEIRFAGSLPEFSACFVQSWMLVTLQLLSALACTKKGLQVTMLTNLVECCGSA